jgi:hypothetical protein
LPSRSSVAPETAAVSWLGVFGGDPLGINRASLCRRFLAMFPLIIVIIKMTIRRYLHRKISSMPSPFAFGASILETMK